MKNLRIPTHKPPTTAGEMLVEEFLKPLGITQTAFAKRIGVTHHRLNEVIKGRRGVTVDTAYRFAKALGTSPDFWLNLQRMTEMYQATHSPAAKEIEKIQPIEREIVLA